jgi:AcrR family transcriptional regulator
MSLKRSVRTREQFVEAATALVREHGWNGLTMRALGDAMGIEHSVAYRHFSNKRALIDAVLDHALATLHHDVSADRSTPRERVLSTLMGFRDMVRQHPHLGPAIMDRRIATPTGQELIRSVIDDLASTGIAGEQLVRCYQALETITIGAAVYDYTRQPGEASGRRTQYQSLGIEAFDVAARDDEAVEAVTEDAFRFSITAVLDAFIAAAD